MLFLVLLVVVAFVGYVAFGSAVSVVASVITIIYNLCLTYMVVRIDVNGLKMEHEVHVNHPGAVPWSEEKCGHCLENEKRIEHIKSL